MTSIAFIGLGNMGGPMAANLADSGHEVSGFDLSEVALAQFGGRRAASVADAVAGASVVVTMLPAGPQVRALYPEIIAAAAPDTLLIDCSTIDVESARAVERLADAVGLAMLDAPVSGGTGGATAGTLTFMVGGAEPAFERARPIFEAMGKTIVHCGGPGTGQAAKICNNMVLGVTMTAVSEAFVLAEKLGLDAQKLFDVSAKSSGQCWALTTYCPVPGPVPSSPANRDYAPGFTVDMMLKDLKLAQQAAQASGAATPLGAEATALYQLLASSGAGGKDFSAIIRMLRGEPVAA